MFQIKKTLKTPSIVWDADNRRPLCKFVKGVFETEDEAVAKKLLAMGYKVDGAFSEEIPAAETKAAEPDEKKTKKG